MKKRHQQPQFSAGDRALVHLVGNRTIDVVVTDVWYCEIHSSHSYTVVWPMRAQREVDVLESALLPISVGGGR